MKSAASMAFYAALRDALEVAPGHGSGAELAKRTGLNRAVLDRWRFGAAEVRPSHLRALAVHLGRSMVIGVYADGAPLVSIGKQQ
jgi:hypothetical protein